jgi:hypothetical protein
MFKRNYTQFLNNVGKTVSKPKNLIDSIYIKLLLKPKIPSTSEFEIAYLSEIKIRSSKREPQNDHCWTTSKVDKLVKNRPNRCHPLETTDIFESN